MPVSRRRSGVGVAPIGPVRQIEIGPTASPRHSAQAQSLPSSECSPAPSGDRKQHGVKSLVSRACVIMAELANENKHYQP